MKRLEILTAIMIVLLLLPLVIQTSSAVTVDLTKWSGSITMYKGGKASWLEDLGGVPNPSFEDPLGATPGTGSWHRRFVYEPVHENVSKPIDYSVLYYDRSADKAYSGSYSFKFDFRWYTDVDHRFPGSPDGYIWYYAQLWDTADPLDSASGNVKVLMFYWVNLTSYNWHTYEPVMLAIDTFIWVNITYLDTSGVERRSSTEVVVGDANYTSTSWELAEVEITDCRRVTNITIELRLRLLSVSYLDYWIRAGSEIRLTWYLDLIVITEPKSVSQTPTATFSATPNGNTVWTLSLDYPATGETSEHLNPKLTAYVSKYWTLYSCKSPTGATVTAYCTRSSYNSTHDAVEIPPSVISSYGAGTYKLTFVQKPATTGVVMRDQYGTISIADVGETVTFSTSHAEGLNSEVIIAYQDGTVYRDVLNTLPASINMPSEPAILVCMIRVWNSTHRTVVRKYFTCDKIRLDLTFTRLNATAVNMTVVTKSKLNGTVLTGTTVVVNKTKKPTTNGRLSEIYTLGAKGIIPVYAFHNAYLMNASDEYSFAWDGNASAWGDANITYFTFNTQYLYEYLETEDLPSGTEVAIHFWRGAYDVDSVQVITGTLVGYTMNSEVIVRARAASPIVIKVVLKTAGEPAPGGGGAVTGGEAPPPPPPEEEVTPPPTPPYVEVKPEWIVAFIIGSLLIYVIFRLSRRYTATFTYYTCPYCGRRLEYAFSRRMGRVILYCPRCKRGFIPAGY